MTLDQRDEVLIQAEMEGACGQVYTFHPRTFRERLTQLPTCPMSVSITILW